MSKELDELIHKYAENKAYLDDYTKICKIQNAEIKDIMAKADITEYETSGYKVKCSETVKESINEDMLLDIAHKENLNDIIKTKEYIDFDVLENLIYNNKISKEMLLQIDKCRETKTTVTLRISKAKKGKED